MESLWQIVLLFVHAVFTSAHEQQQLPSSIPIPVQQNGQHGTPPQVYISNQNPAEFGSNNPASTTVCVEIRSNPNYKVCGPDIPQLLPAHQQYPQGIYQNQPSYTFPFKDSNKENAAGQQAQPLPSEPKPVVTNQRGLLITPWGMQQSSRSPVIIPQASMLVPKQYMGPPQPNSITTDGSLSMNCKVSGVKYSNLPGGSSNFPSPGFNNMAYRVLQQQPIAMMSQDKPLYMVKPDQMNQFMMAMDGNQMWMPLNTNGRNSDQPLPSPFNMPNMMTMDMNQPSQMNPHPNMMTTDMNQPSQMNPQKIEEENKRNLIELKKQIAELTKLTDEQQRQDASNNQQPNSNSQPQSHPSSQMNEQKLNKTMGQQMGKYASSKLKSM